MKYQLTAILMLAIAGCGQEQPKAPLKTTYSDIQKSFAENGVAAKKLYSAQPVLLTDTVNSIKEGGLVFLVNDQMESYGVLVRDGSREKLAHVKPGDKITVTCTSVDSLSIGGCEVSR